ncbi:hypothetical protein OG285_32005 [Streptomyces sp. NBC_01471]|uniref:hypothetical protein n=1 Tax=Streptomyces sp. NBC_01471 TaxID=2903879 RepID=UPI003256001E
MQATQWTITLMQLGLLGGTAMTVYLEAYKRVSLALLPSGCRRRVQIWRRVAPPLRTASVCVLAAGALAFLITAVG